MARITTRDRVFNYFDHQEEWGLPKLIYRKGKWFELDPKLPYARYVYDIRSYLYYLDRRTTHNKWNNQVFNFSEPCQLDNFVQMYADVFGEDADWYDNKFAVLGKNYSNNHITLPPLPYDLDIKQLTIISVLLYQPKEEALFITTGIGGSGKSTFLNIIKQLFPHDFYCCTLSELTDTHTMAEAVQKSLICGDEIGTKELNLDNLKVLASKQEVSVNPKFERPYTMKSQSAVFYCCNKPPRIDLTDSGILRRLIYYFRNEKIYNPDKNQNSRQYSEDELTIIAAYAYRQLNPNWRELFEEETWKLQMSVNSVFRYYKEAIDYPQYSELCKSDGLKPCGKPNWEEIREMIKEHEQEQQDLPF